MNPLGACEEADLTQGPEILHLSQAYGDLGAANPQTTHLVQGAGDAPSTRLTSTVCLQDRDRDFLGLGLHHPVPHGFPPPPPPTTTHSLNSKVWINSVTKMGH